MVFTETKRIIVLHLCLGVIRVTYLPRLHIVNVGVLRSRLNTFMEFLHYVRIFVPHFPLQLGGLNSSILLYLRDITVSVPLPCCTLVSPS
jgi:hypothetical protein